METIEISDDDESVCLDDIDLVQELCNSPPSTIMLKVNLDLQKNSLPGTQNEKEQVLVTRIAKFSSSKIINLQKGPRDPILMLPQNSDLCPLAFIIYGVDYLKKRDLINCLKTTQCTRIGESSMLAQYENIQTVKQMLWQQLLNPQILEIKMETQDGILFTGWLAMKPQYVCNYQQSLKIRYAATKQLQIQFCNLQKNKLILKAAQQAHNNCSNETDSDDGDRSVRYIGDDNSFDSRSVRKKHHIHPYSYTKYKSKVERDQRQLYEPKPKNLREVITID